MDLGDFRTIISAKLGLNNDPAFDQPLIDTWVNRGYIDVLVKSRCKITTATMALTPGAYDYTLATSLLAVNEAFVTDVQQTVTYRLEHVSPQEILDYRVGTQFAGAPPVRFYAVDGHDLLMVYPTPDAADTITIYYTARPDTLTQDSDEPSDVPVEWQTTIEMYACWQAGQYQNDVASQNGQTYLAMYFQELRNLKKASLKMAGRRLSPAVVGHRSRRPIGRPDQQWV